MRQLLLFLALFILWSAAQGQDTIPDPRMVSEYVSTAADFDFPYPDSSDLSIQLQFDEQDAGPQVPGRIYTSSSPTINNWNTLVSKWGELTRKWPTIEIEEYDELNRPLNLYWIIVTDLEVIFVKRYGPTGLYSYFSQSYTGRQSWIEEGHYTIKHTMWELGKGNHLAIAYNKTIKAYGFEIVCNDELKESVAAPLGLYRIY